MKSNDGHCNFCFYGIPNEQYTSTDFPRQEAAQIIEVYCSQECQQAACESRIRQIAELDQERAIDPDYYPNLYPLPRQETTT